VALAEQGEGKRNETKRHVFLATYLYPHQTSFGRLRGVIFSFDEVWAWAWTLAF